VYTNRTRRYLIAVDCNLQNSKLIEHFVVAVPAFRTRYYQEAQEGLYSGPLFLLSYWLLAVPFAVISVGAATRITFLWVQPHHMWQLKSHQLM
jgi:hypothetical protein